MKRILSAVTSMLLTLSLTACGSAGGSDVPPAEPDTEPPVEESGEQNVLVAYFSWSGNTEEIQPATPYPTDYDACGEVALAERDSNARPAIANLPATLDEYDVIFIGYPIWWHTAPMIVGTFLESYDLEGKAVYPFTQSASMDEEQFGNSMDFVRQSAGGAAVHDGLFARPADTQAIDEYLAASGLAG